MSELSASFASSSAFVALTTGPSLKGNSTETLEGLGADLWRRRRGLLRGKEPSRKEYQGSYVSSVSQLHERNSVSELTGG